MARDGKSEPIAAIPPSRFDSPRLSSDGKRVLLRGDGDARIYDLATGRERRVTSDRSVGRVLAAHRHSTAARSDLYHILNADGGATEPTRMFESPLDARDPVRWPRCRWAARASPRGRGTARCSTGASAMT